MKIELSDNKVFFKNNGSKKEIHPFWLRERVNGKDFVDKGSQQRLFDPTELKGNIKIKNVSLSDRYLKVACLLYTSPSPRDRSLSRMPSSA